MTKVAPLDWGASCGDGTDTARAFVGHNAYPQKASELLPQRPDEEEHGRRSTAFGS